MYKQFNLTNPEYGIKGYNLQDSNLEEPIYKKHSLGLAHQKA
jgi:hypothetical protein